MSVIAKCPHSKSDGWCSECASWVHPDRTLIPTQHRHTTIWDPATLGARCSDCGMTP